MGDLPYEEYYLILGELLRLNKMDPVVYKVYRELMCHIHICHVCHMCGNVNTFRAWSDYLFSNLDNKLPVRTPKESSLDEIQERMDASGFGNAILDKSEGHFNACDTLYSYHF